MNDIRSGAQRRREARSGWLGRGRAAGPRGNGLVGWQRGGVGGRHRMKQTGDGGQGGTSTQRQCWGRTGRGQGRIRSMHRGGARVVGTGTHTADRQTGLVRRRPAKRAGAVPRNAFRWHAQAFICINSRVRWRAGVSKQKCQWGSGSRMLNAAARLAAPALLSRAGRPTCCCCWCARSPLPPAEWRNRESGAKRAS